MADFPPNIWDILGLVDVTITPQSPCSLNVQDTDLAPASATYPAADRALFYPVRLSQPVLVKVLYWVNGATVAGNVDVGIYDEAGTRLLSTGSTAQATVSVLQQVNVTDTLIGPGLFYLAIAASLATATFLSQNAAADTMLQAGVAQMATAMPLPATATLEKMVSVYKPLFGASLRATI